MKYCMFTIFIFFCVYVLHNKYVYLKIHQNYKNKTDFHHLLLRADLKIHTKIRCAIGFGIRAKFKSCIYIYYTCTLESYHHLYESQFPLLKNVCYVNTYPIEWMWGPNEVFNIKIDQAHSRLKISLSFNSTIN